MKKSLFMTCLLLCAATVGVQANGNGKVKKTKTTKMGIFVEGASESYSLSGWDSKSGMSIGAYFGASALMKPRKPENHWGWGAAIGIKYFGGSLERQEKHSYSTRLKCDVTSVSMFDMKGDVKYFFNPLSTRGKWYIKGGVSVCPLQINVPVEKESSTYSKNTYIDSGAMGVSLSIGAHFGYEAKHWGASIGAHYGAMTTYSSENSSVPTFCGFGASFQYFF